METEKIGNKKIITAVEGARRKGGCAMKYEKPEIRIAIFATGDVITTSFDNIGEPGIDVDWE